MLITRLAVLIVLLLIPAAACPDSSSFVGEWQGTYTSGTRTITATLSIELVNGNEAKIGFVARGATQQLAIATTAQIEGDTIRFHGQGRSIVLTKNGNELSGTLEGPRGTSYPKLTRK
jgi:hypothetical protein